MAILVSRLLLEGRGLGGGLEEGSSSFSSLELAAIFPKSLTLLGLTDMLLPSSTIGLTACNETMNNINEHYRN